MNKEREATKENHPRGGGFVCDFRRNRATLGVRRYDRVPTVSYGVDFHTQAHHNQPHLTAFCISAERKDKFNLRFE